MVCNCQSHRARRSFMISNSLSVSSSIIISKSGSIRLPFITPVSIKEWVGHWLSNRNNRAENLFTK